MRLKISRERSLSCRKPIAAASAAAFGHAGRRRVEAQFSWERIAERTLEVYQEAIAAHRSASATYQPTLHGGSSAQPSRPSPSA